jgi:uncharacterized protein with PQ loop repeat
MKHKCGYSLSENFVKSIIGEDTQLLQKYDKFLTRRKLMESNKKIKFCPFPDCDGYAEKTKKKEKIVKCNFGHEFCFQCGNKPHPDQKCSEIVDKDFEVWKSKRVLKRCPHCKFWTEKNEGCNHMTCVQCKFQWCWLCQKECLIGHFSSGSCKGCQFLSETNQEKIKTLLEENTKKYPPKSLCIRILISLCYFLVFLFLSPQVYAIGKYKDCLKNVTNPAVFIFYGLTLFIYLVYTVIRNIAIIAFISIPAILIPPYYRFLRYIFLSRILGLILSEL